MEQDGDYVLKNLSLTTESDKNEQCINNNIVQSSQNVSPFPVENDLQEEGGCHCIIAETKIHDY